MNENKLFNALQIATGVAVVIGLIMVFIELQQAKSLSLAELTSEGYAEVMADFRTVMGENSAEVIAKSCITPEQLNAQELVILNAYYNSKLAQVSRLRVLEFVADFGVPWQTLAHQQLQEVLATKPGQQWFEFHLKTDPELYGIGKKILATGVDCTGFINSIAFLPNFED
ncbi:MAG: hypothetical protein AAF541_13995 [Pseudomonadota bacterium]